MGERLRVSLDATPLIGRPTGVGTFCAGLLGGLAERTDLDVSVFAVSWRRREAIAGRVPAGVSTTQRAMPARPLHLAWGRLRLPPLEWFVGATDVVHGTNYVVPPTRRAARVMSVHDLTTVRFPDMCDRATLAFPDLVRLALAGGAWVHTHCEYIASEVIDHFGADADRVRAIAPGIPALPPADEAAAAHLLPDGAERYVLAVGTHEPRKDLPGLVRAFDAVSATRRDLALVLAGPRGWGSDDLATALG
ncbi:MAG: glycosyltransferase, partial [Acidimicrobiales bacterium]